MGEKTTEEWIIQQLRWGEQPKDLIVRVCERTGLNWEDAKQLIERVATQQTAAIRTGKRRMAVLIGIPTICGGIYLLLISTFAIIWNTFRIAFTEITHPIVYVYFVVGLLMVGGAVYGMIRGK